MRAQKKSRAVLLLSALLGLSVPPFVAPTEASTREPLELRIKNHRYSPEILEVKAGERFKIRVYNDDPTSEEFESKSMIIEKFIGPQRSILITLGPLKPGTYDFFGCFHPQTAKGKVLVK